ncbi:MAG: sialate O-acetylesterase [Bacteroidetes bacterium]|nr:sialate O-acetylesterase [Bacteroidota bacterium]
MFRTKLSKISFYLIQLLMYVGSFQLWAQVTILYPYERTVYQRKNDNTGKINISGNLDSYADKVEARLIPRIEGQGVATSWQIIDSQPDALSFTGTLDGTGGWYRLEVRAVKDGVTTFSNAVERVGIGEIFVIAGQSNAQGEGEHPNAKGATDDRVNAYHSETYNVKTYLASTVPDFYKYEPFVQLSQNIGPGPTGFTPWAYGELGDMLAKKLNVPVLFFNAGASGTSTENWVKSINGQDTYQLILGFKLEQYHPYLPFKKILQSFINVLGLRAVLWHQGEYDIYNTDTGYLDNMKKIIQESRNNTGENIPWVISRVSRIFNRNFPNVISGQNLVLSNVANTWPGPATDDIQPLRPDGAHFENTASEAGLSILANAWNNALTTSFFQNVTPILPESIVEMKHVCANDQVNTTVYFANPYSFYLWSGGQKTSTLTLTQGDASAYLKDGYGNILLTNKVVIPNVYPKIVPVITTSPSLRVCEGNAVTFEAQSPKYPVWWSVNFENNKFIINLPGNYSARYKTSQNCFSAPSATFTPIFVKPPTKPEIGANDAKFFTCEGSTLEFFVKNAQNLLYEWSTGATTPNVKVNENLSKPLWVKTYSNFDCPSPQSDTVSYRIVKNPKAPAIEKNGPYSLKAITAETISRYDWYMDNNLLFSQTSPLIGIKKDGIYSVRTVNSFKKPTGDLLECVSGKSTQLVIDLDEKLFGIQVYPNPSYDNKFYLASNLNLKKVNFRVYNILGQMVHQGAIGNLDFPFQVDLGYLKPVGKHYVEIEYQGVTRVFQVLFQ